jgi:hypothetical protein
VFVKSQFKLIKKQTLISMKFALVLTCILMLPCCNLLYVCHSPEYQGGDPTMGCGKVPLQGIPELRGSFRGPLTRSAPGSHFKSIEFVSRPFGGTSCNVTFAPSLQPVPIVCRDSISILASNLGDCFETFVIFLDTECVIDRFQRSPSLCLNFCFKRKYIVLVSSDPLTFPLSCLFLASTSLSLMNPLLSLFIHIPFIVYLLEMTIPPAEPESDGCVPQTRCYSSLDRYRRLRKVFKFEPKLFRHHFLIINGLKRIPPLSYPYIGYMDIQCCHDFDSTTGRCYFSGHINLSSPDNSISEVIPVTADSTDPHSYIGSYKSESAFRRACLKSAVAHMDSVLKSSEDVPQSLFTDVADVLSSVLDVWLLVVSLLNTKSSVIRTLYVVQFFRQRIIDALLASFNQHDRLVEQCVRDLKPARLSWYSFQLFRPVLPSLGSSTSEPQAQLRVVVHDVAALLYAVSQAGTSNLNAESLRHAVVPAVLCAEFPVAAVTPLMVALKKKFCWNTPPQDFLDAIAEGTLSDSVVAERLSSFISEQISLHNSLDMEGRGRVRNQAIADATMFQGGYISSRVESILGSIKNVKDLLLPLLPFNENVEVEQAATFVESLTEFSSVLKSFGGLIAGISSYQVMKCISTVVALVAMISASPMGFSWTAFKAVHTKMMACPIPEMGSAVGYLITSLNWLVTFGVSMYKGQLDIFASQNISKWTAEASKYKCFNDLDINHTNFDPISGTQTLNTFQLYDRIHKLEVTGQAVLDKAKVIGADSAKEITSLLCYLGSLKDKVDAFNKVCSNKEAAFGVLTYAESAIAKTTWIKYLRTELQRAHKLPTDEMYTYVMPSDTNFMDGFRTQHHTVILDDIGASANSKTIVDHTLDYMIKLVNNISFYIESAAVATKGKYCWVGKFVLGTTNFRDMNAHATFVKPAAAIRRMPYLVELVPAQTGRMGSIVLDEGRLHEGFQDWWKIKIFHVTATPETADGITRELIFETSHTNEAMRFLVERSFDHFNRQAQFTRTMAAIDSMPICPKCLVSKGACICKCPICSRGPNPVYVADCRVPEHLEVQQAYNHSLTPEWLCGCVGALFIYASIHHAYMRLKPYFLFYRSSRAVVNKFQLASQHITENKWYYAAGFSMVLVVLGAMIRGLQGASMLEQADVDPVEQMPSGTRPFNIWGNVRSAPHLTERSLRAKGESTPACVVGLTRAVCRIHVYRSGIQATTAFACALGDPYPDCLVLNKHTLADERDGKKLPPISKIVCNILAAGELNSGDSPVFCKDILPGSYTKLEGDGDLLILRVLGFRREKGIYHYLLKYPYAVPPQAALLLAATTISNSISSIAFDIANRLQPFSYQFSDNPTTFGDCGRPLVGIFDGSPAVIGIHAAGNEEMKRGRSFALSQDVIENLIPKPTPNDAYQVLSSGYVRPEFGSEGDIMNRGVTCGVGNKHTPINPCYSPEPVSNMEFVGTVGRLNSYNTEFITPRYMDHFSDISGPPLHVPPNLSPTDRDIGWKPVVNYISNVGAPCGLWDVPCLYSAAGALIQFWTPILSKANSREHGTLGVFPTVNGIDGASGLEGLNMKSGFGFPDNIPKLNAFTTTVDDSGANRYWLKPDYLTRYTSLVEQVEKGIVPNFVVCAHRKDEPIKPAKMLERGCRLIFAAPTFLTMLLRRYFGLLLCRIYDSRIPTGIAVGMNCSNVEWTALYNHLTQVGFKCLAGDFKNFDQKLPWIITALSLHVLHSINIGLPNQFSDTDRVAMLATLQSVVSHYMLMDRQMFCIAGPNPSGQALTTHTNCTSVVLMLLYCWIKAGYTAESFFVNCRFTTYGDDHVVCVRDGFEQFNYDHVCQTLASVGIEYTTFDKKCALGKTYDHIHDVQFLKRAFNKLPDFIAAPLDISSIMRRMYITRKPTTSIQDHETDVLSSMWDDSFLHASGCEIRDKIESWMRSCKFPMPEGKFKSKALYIAAVLASSASYLEYHKDPVPGFTLSLESALASVWDWEPDLDCHTQMGYKALSIIFRACVVAPLAEESMKRMGKSWKWGLIVYEFVEYSHQAGWSIPMVLLRLVVGCAHYYWASLPFILGVACHTLWNFIAVFPVILATSVFFDPEATMQACGGNRTTCPMLCRGTPFFSNC